MASHERNPVDELQQYVADAVAQLRSGVEFNVPADLRRHMLVPVLICELALEELADRLSHAWLGEAGWRVR